MSSISRRRDRNGIQTLDSRVERRVPNPLGHGCSLINYRALDKYSNVTDEHLKVNLERMLHH